MLPKEVQLVHVSGGGLFTVEVQVARSCPYTGKEMTRTITLSVLQSWSRVSTAVQTAVRTASIAVVDEI